MRIGFAGLGRMGGHMARNLARTLPPADFSLSVWNRTPAKALALETELGCAVCQSPRALSDASDIVITMLADDPSSETVHSGPDGLFDGKARTYLEMGTMSPDHIEALAVQAPTGSRIIDAPVSGATQAAADAALLIMAGCNEEAAADLMPLFDAMGRRTMFMGKRGAGAVMKLAVNSLIHGINQTMAEAMTLAEAAGIGQTTAFDVIEDSAAGAPMLKYRRPLYLDEANHDVTFTVALARKDMDMTTAFADRLGTSMPQGRITRDKLRQAEALGYGDRDMAAMLDYMRKEHR
jgi:3-hydroxyisobutyrate dehydrogenase